MPRLTARSHLLWLIAVAVAPVWLFAAYLLTQYALTERDRFEREAVQVARQVSLVVEGELVGLAAVLEGLSKSGSLDRGDMESLYGEARRLVEGTDRIILLRDYAGHQIFNTQLPYGADIPTAPAMKAAEIDRARAGQRLVTDVYQSPVSGEYRIAIALPVSGPEGEEWLFAITIPTSRLRDVMVPAVPDGWTVAIGDSTGSYVARSKLHEELTGKPGLPEYVAKVVGQSGTFTSRNLQGATLLAGYYRSGFSDWFYTANVALSVVQAPLWSSLAAIGAIALLAMVLSVGLAFFVGGSIARAARQLAAQAEALGSGRPVGKLTTSVREFTLIAEAMAGAGRALSERTRELQAVLETVPVAVWFTYDPRGRQVIRNRYAAELMGLSAEPDRHVGTPDLVIDTIAVQEGQTVSRDDRPLTKAMRGVETDNEEFSYLLPNGINRVLLTSARPIRDVAGAIIGAVQVSRDITESKRSQRQRKLLIKELNHRVKNTLAVVQSIANQTLRGASDIPEASAALSRRLVSLAKAHDILTQENWSGADLREFISATVATHAGLERFRLSGEPVRLTPNLTLSLALGFHELTTNAIKYGALSNAAGTVSITWTLSGADPRRLRIEWRERDGPPVTPAVRTGFGTRLLERILSSEPGGKVEVKLDPAGLVCVFEVDLARDGDEAATEDYAAV